MKQVAILGYGVVGSGVAEVLRSGREAIAGKAGEEIRVRAILDVRDFPGDPHADRIVHDPEKIFRDPEIDIVVETIGGTGLAYAYSRRALESGKHLVTSNKELVAEHGPELLSLSRRHGCRYMFEASVGGGIPIIRPLMQCLAANDITAVRGILNGTTNYILTRMNRHGEAFYQALAEAQALGYAEADPDNDILGRDACRKIAILAGIAFEKFIDYREIPTEGIAGVTGRDFLYAAALDHTIKLVAAGRRENGCVEAIVAPMLIPAGHPLYGVEDVFNAIVVTGSAVGDAMFYGRGAGKLPTASAIAADIIDIVRNPQVASPLWGEAQKGCLADPGKSRYRYLVRLTAQNKALKQGTELKRELERRLPGRIPVVLPQGAPAGETAFVTGIMTEETCREALAALNAPGTAVKGDAGKEGISRLRFIQVDVDRETGF